MMPSPKLMPLYLGTSIASLKTLFDNLPNNRDIKMLCKSAPKLFTSAQKLRAQGDEEKSYIFYMKYLNIYSFVRNSVREAKDNKKSEYKEYKESMDKFMSFESATKAMDIAEELSKRLEQRYDALRADKQKDIETKKQSQEATRIIEDSISQIRIQENEAVAPSSTVTNGPNISEGCISSIDLFPLLQKDHSKVLIMDTRTTKEFEESHINFESCISVPAEVVVLGCSAAKLGLQIPPASKSKWQQRLNVDYLVLLDWSSASLSVSKDSKVSILHSILTEWDPGVNYKTKPVILRGGYENWLDSYPMYVTNPKPTFPSQSLDDLLGIDDVQYPVLDDTPKFSRTTKPPPTPQSDVPASELPSSSSKPSLHSSVYGEPLPLNSTPSIDRSSKAAALEKYQELEREQAKIAESSQELTRNCEAVEQQLQDVKQQQNKKELSDQEKDLLQEQAHKLQQDITDLRKSQLAKEAENESLRKQLDEYKKRDLEATVRQTPKPAFSSLNNGNLHTKTMAENNGTVRGKGMSESISASQETKQEGQMQKGKGESSLSVHSEMPPSSGMKRSRSSPNIAQELDMEHKPNKPQFDRTTKPMHQKPPSSEVIISRHRNFHPVYGTVRAGLTGLKNLGNSCYMNSVLQCISNTTLLSKYFCSGKYQVDVNRSHSNPTRGEVVEEVAQVVRNLWYGHYRSIACRDLKAVVGSYMDQFRGTIQQDAHEFLTFLIDWLHNDVKVRKEKAVTEVGKLPPQNTSNKGDALTGATKAWNDFKQSNESIILTLFFVQQVSTVSCDNCRERSVTYEEPTSNLTLLLPSNSSRCSLLECLRLYTQKERISEYKCESCKELHAAEKKVDLCRLPPILIIHLKRFYSDGFYQKRQTFVDFPLTSLDMGDYTLDRKQRYTVYNLFGVSNHYGTLEGGHYTAYCKNGNQWYKFDDSDVSEISASDVKSANAYILFYAAVGADTSVIN